MMDSLRTPVLAVGNDLNSDLTVVLTALEMMLRGGEDRALLLDARAAAQRSARRVKNLSTVAYVDRATSPGGCPAD